MRLHGCPCVPKSHTRVQLSGAGLRYAPVLGSLGPDVGLEAWLFEGVFPLSLSSSSLIDMLLPCSLPKDHTQASSVWTESSVGLEKSTVAPPGTGLPVGLQVGGGLAGEAFSELTWPRVSAVSPVYLGPPPLPHPLRRPGQGRNQGEPDGDSDPPRQANYLMPRYINIPHVSVRHLFGVHVCVKATF